VERAPAAGIKFLFLLKVERAPAAGINGMKWETPTRNGYNAQGVDLTFLT